jgi:hypothetical protein
MTECGSYSDCIYRRTLLCFCCICYIEDVLNNISIRNTKVNARAVKLTILLSFCVVDIRLQLGEQLRCLDARMESQVALVTELQDYFRRRAEVELDYSKGLDKLAKGLSLRHREQKQKWVSTALGYTVLCTMHTARLYSHCNKFCYLVASSCRYLLYTPSFNTVIWASLYFILFF